MRIVEKKNGNYYLEFFGTAGLGPRGADSQRVQISPQRDAWRRT